jgi:single-strand DNA-binding protein
MSSLNQCNFIGNVGKIETRYMTNGDAVTNLSIACNESWKSKDGEKQEKTEWVNCVIYRKLAEIAAEYVRVGSQLFVSGKMQTRKWQDKETGKDRYTTEIIVNDMKMLGGKRDSGQAESGAPAQDAQPGATHKVASNPGNFDNFDDDIPF